MGRTRVMVLAACAALVATVNGQDAPRPAFRVGSELVVVDLVPTDRAGNLAADLQPSEIQLLENGKPQKIRFVTLVRGGHAATGNAVSPAAAGAAAPSPSSLSASPEMPRERTSLAIVLDLGSMPPDAFPRVREAVLQMVRDDLPPGTSVMLATLSPGVTVRQPFTTDRASLIAAIEALPVSFGGHLTLAEIVEKVENSCDLAGGVALRDSAVAVARSLVVETRQRLVTVSDNLATLSRSLAPLPGRKHIVLYSAGYFLNPASDAVEVVSTSISACSGADAPTIQRAIAQEIASISGDESPAIQTAIDRANRSQVSFYTIDPRGLVTTNVQAQHRGSARAGRGGSSQKVAALDQTRSQDFLHTIAASTGGRTFLNTNDLTTGLRRAWQDASEYYLIGYTPAGSRKKGHFQKIEVKVARADLDLRYRRGYYDVTEQQLAQRDVESALRNPASFAQEGFEAEARVENGKLWVTTLIPPSAIRFTADADTHTADFSVHATLRDAKGKLVGGKPVIGRDLAVRLPPERLSTLRGSGNVEVRTDVNPPPPGTYELAVVVRDSGGWIAARSLTVVVQR